MIIISNKLQNKFKKTLCTNWRENLHRKYMVVENKEKQSATAMYGEHLT